MEATNPIQWAADLREALRASGTGAAKISAISAAMAERFDEPALARLPADHPDRHLTAAEAVEVLERAGAGEVTLDKARQLVATGRYKAPPPPTPRGELIPPPPRGPAPTRAPLAGRGEPPVPIAGPADLSLKDVDTVGPKPVGDEPPAEKATPKKPKRGGKKKPAATADEVEPAEEPADEGHEAGDHEEPAGSEPAEGGDRAVGDGAEQRPG